MSVIRTTSKATIDNIKHFFFFKKHVCCFYQHILELENTYIFIDEAELIRWFEIVDCISDWDGKKYTNMILNFLRKTRNSVKWDLGKHAGCLWALVIRIIGVILSRPISNWAFSKYFHFTHESKCKRVVSDVFHSDPHVQTKSQDVF